MIRSEGSIMSVRTQSCGVATFELDVESGVLSPLFDEKNCPAAMMVGMSTMQAVY